MTNSLDPDEMAHYEPSHLDLHCLQRYLFWSVGLKVVRGQDTPGGFSAIFYKETTFETSGLVSFIPSPF